MNKKFKGIDELFREEGESEQVCTVTAAKREAGNELFKTTITLPRSLHRQVKKYAIDTGMKDKDVMTMAIQEFIEKHK